LGRVLARFGNPDGCIPADGAVQFHGGGEQGQAAAFSGQDGLVVAGQQVFTDFRSRFGFQVVAAIVKVVRGRRRAVRL